MPTTEWEIKLRAHGAEHETLVRVELGWSPSAGDGQGSTCLLVESQTVGLDQVAELRQTDDCRPIAYEQLVQVPEHPSLGLGLVLLAGLARGRRRE